MNVLIVGGRQMVRHGLKIVLKNIWPAVTVFEAEDLEIGILLFSGHTIELTIFDLNLSQHDHLEKLIRFLAVETRIVICTEASNNSMQIDSLISAGADAFIFEDSSVRAITEIFQFLDRDIYPN